MFYKNLGIIVLAAGKGTRMHSEVPKVLHLINGRIMISYVLECAALIADEKNIVVVVGHQADKVQTEISKRFNPSFALQKTLAGTGDAVRSGLPYLGHNVEDIIILCGDVPLIKSKTLLDLLHYHRNSLNDLTVLAANLADPSGYGRILLDSAGNFLCIKEEADANSEERLISLVNSGIYCVKREFLAYSLGCIKKNNAQGEYYLTDIAGIARDTGAQAGFVVVDNPVELTGVNTVHELKRIEEMILLDQDQ